MKKQSLKFEPVEIDLSEQEMLTKLSIELIIAATAIPPSLLGMKQRKTKNEIEIREELYHEHGLQ